MSATTDAATTYVGIDVAAQTLAVARLVPGTPAAPAETVANTAAGWRQLARQLRQVGVEPGAALLVMEATGS